jgi:hypothetical protein
MGFVRSKFIMKNKVIHMQERVFETPHDSKLDGSDVFDWRRWFSDEDLSPIEEDLPIFVQQWAKERDEINSK